MKIYLKQSKRKLISLFVVLMVLSFNNVNNRALAADPYVFDVNIEGLTCTWTQGGPEISGELVLNPEGIDLEANNGTFSVKVSAPQMTTYENTRPFADDFECDKNVDSCQFDLGVLKVPQQYLANTVDGTYLTVEAETSFFKAIAGVGGNHMTLEKSTGCFFQLACTERPDTIGQCGTLGGCDFAGQDYICEPNGACTEDAVTCGDTNACSGKILPGISCNPALDTCCDIGGNDYECEFFEGFLKCGLAGTGDDADDIVGPPPYDGPIIDFDSLLLYAYELLQPVVVLFIGLPRIIYSGYKLKTSDGDPAKIKQGKSDFGGAISATLLAALGVTVLRVGIQLALGITI